MKNSSTSRPHQINKHRLFFEEEYEKVKKLGDRLADRISFRKFLGFPENIPDYSTVWRFRMRRIHLIRGMQILERGGTSDR
ncbi:MAG: transposase [Candidatus Syntropharchaeia archaeon]